MKQRNKKQTTLKTFAMMLKRRKKLFALTFFPLLLLSFLYTHFAVEINYRSTTTIEKPTYINNIQYQLIQLKITSYDFVSTVKKDVNKAGIKHKNGSKITYSEILSGILYHDFEHGKMSLSFSYISSEANLSKSILSIIANNCVNELGWEGLHVSEQPKEGIPLNNKSGYLIGFSAASLFLSFAIAFVVECFDDRLYDEKELEMFGNNIIEVGKKENDLSKVILENSHDKKITAVACESNGSFYKSIFYNHLNNFTNACILCLQKNLIQSKEMKFIQNHIFDCSLNNKRITVKIDQYDYNENCIMAFKDSIYIKEIIKNNELENMSGELFSNYQNIVFVLPDSQDCYYLNNLPSSNIYRKILIVERNKTKSTYLSKLKKALGEKNTKFNVILFHL